LVGQWFVAGAAAARQSQSYFILTRHQQLSSPLLPLTPLHHQVDLFSPIVCLPLPLLLLLLLLPTVGVKPLRNAVAFSTR